MARTPHPAQRSGFRFRLPCHVSYGVGRLQGTARLHDISASGCRVEGASLTPQPGTRIQLSIHLSDQLGLFGAELSVVRRTESGFAGRFEVTDPQLALKLLRVAKQQVREPSLHATGLAREA